MAQGSHLALAFQEQGSSFTVMRLPATAGSGTPALVDYASSFLSNFQGSLHGLGAYVSPSNGKAYGLVVVSEGARAGGYASEVVARLVDEAWDALKAAPVRVTAKDTPVPYAATLEREVLPQVEDVVAGIRRVLEGVPA